MNALMPHAYIIELLTDFFSFSTLRKFYEKRSRPKYGTSKYFWMVHQQLIDNPPPPPKPYVAPCGGTGNHSDSSWWEERLEDRIYEDDDESFGAQMSRLSKLIRLDREGKEGEPEAVQLRERMDKSRRAYTARNG